MIVLSVIVASALVCCWPFVAFKIPKQDKKVLSEKLRKQRNIEL